MKYDRSDQAKQAVRSAILTAALELADEVGWERLTVRAIAARIGYTAPIVYEHFGSKANLLDSIVHSGFAEFADRLAEGLCRAERGGESPLTGIAKVYWDFAIRRANLYLLMHQLPGIPFGTRETPEPARRCFAFLRAAVEHYHPDVTGDELDLITDQFWATLHGHCTLALGHRIKGGNRRARRSLLAATERFSAGHTR